MMMMMMMMKMITMITSYAGDDTTIRKITYANGHENETLKNLMISVQKHSNDGAYNT